MWKKIINYSIIIFWIFVIGSVFGFFAEMLYALVYTRTLEIRQGLIYGPFIQIYGLGAVAYYILISNIQEPKLAFFSGMAMRRYVRIFMFFFSRNLFWNYFMGLFSFVYELKWKDVTFILCILGNNSYFLSKSSISHSSNKARATYS